MSKKQLTPEQQQLHNELKLLVKRANQRLVRLEREFGVDSWATKKLKSRLSTEKLRAFSVNNRILLNKSMSITQLRAVKKATEQFLNSKTSTIKGIKSIKKETIKSLKETFENENEVILEDDEIESLYSILEDNDYNSISSFLPPSDIWVIINEARTEHYNQDTFLNKVEKYIDFGNDITVRNNLISLYNKYVK